ncbi:MAG TPA: ABC transporter ATP-binding protein [Alphaproteobacteria bacterium]|jgi:NitT/TauT family transport system ATP-binding protein|nr:ABC transporter ATP-binding protein [Alphaproteobacteria bacterium]
MTALSVEIKSKTYAARTPGANHTALKDLSFTVPEGEFACIVGPSGSGKTTLLNIVGGLDREMEGVVRIGDGGGTAPSDLPIGYMFQTPRLFPWLSVLDNVRVVMDGKSIEAGEAENLLKEMHLGDVMQAFPNRLSGGMQRRVALARAFAVKPQLLLMDEPFVSLDAPVANKLRRLLLDTWKARRTTVLFVTHDLGEALSLADRILFLSPSPGRIVLDLPVNLPRPRNLQDPAIDALRRDLLARYPQLLAGLVNVAHERA